MTNSTSGDRVIRDHPHPAFTRLADNGYRIEYIAPADRDPLIVLAMRGGEVVGSSAFHFPASDPTRLHPQNTYVETDHRRRGVADGLFVFAEMFSAKVISDALWGCGEGQLNSPSAGPFLNRPNRPFGLAT